MADNRQFFKMQSGDKYTLIIIILYTIITFLFVSSSATFFKMAIFGWLMGLFMFIAPIVSLIFMKFEYNQLDTQKKQSTNI